jgi:hypothetical protein
MHQAQPRRRRPHKRPSDERLARGGRLPIVTFSGRVAVVGCREFADGDWPLLGGALRERGLEPVFSVWDDPTVDWGSFVVVLLRSTWDCVTRPGGYLAWAERVAGVSMLLNPVEMLRWNLNKRYLQDLADEHIAVVPTTWVGPLDRWDPPPGEFVVKPTISGGGIDTARYGPEHHPHAERHVRGLQRQGRQVMVQPYLPSVDTNGETALVFIGGRFSHAVSKKALLRLGEGVVPRLWEREVIALTTPTQPQTFLAQAALGSVCRRFGTDPVYCRIDILGGVEDAPVILEVELIDPVLFFPLVPAAAERLADAVQRIASDHRARNAPG